MQRTSVELEGQNCTSFGLNGNCAGTGGVFRTDRKDVLDFVKKYLP